METEIIFIISFINQVIPSIFGLITLGTQKQGVVEKTVKGSQTPRLIQRAEEPGAYWSYIGVYFGLSVGALLVGIWLVFIK